MWEFICELLPVLAFLTGTLLGGLIISLFNREQRRHLEAQYRNTSNANVALESQLTAKTRLEDDLSRTNTELEKLRQRLEVVHNTESETLTKLKKDNKKLQKKVRNFSIKASPNTKGEASDYQLFLSELERSVKKAKKRSSKTAKREVNIGLKKEEKKKKQSKKTKSSKYELYKKKFSSKKLDAAALFAPVKKKAKKDLTYLYGITPEIQDLLNEGGIKTFTDLSQTKIAELRALLALGGEKFEKLNPLNWPIQARIAGKGQWDILDEYKSKMNSAS